MKAKVITVGAPKGVICKTCLRKREGGLIKKGEKALRITRVSVTGARYENYFCVSHARSIIKMFAELEI